MIREKEIEAYLRRVARKHGGCARKFMSPGRRGVPDDVLTAACLEPPVIFVEVKSPQGTLAPHQGREHERMRAEGATVVVVDSKDSIDALFAERCTDPRHEVAS